MRLALVFILFSQLALAQKPSEYVNLFIGTRGHGHTFPGATVPFGMVQLSPDTRIDGSWDGCSGYHYSDSFLYGFSHTHLSGTGVSDYGDILLLPSAYPISFTPEEYKTKFSHKDEIAKANYYEVYLPENEVKARLTSDTRTGIHQYIFEENKGYLLLDLKHRDRTLDFKINQKGRMILEGFRISEGWAKEQHCYYSMEFSSAYTTAQFNADSSKVLMYFEELKNNTLECYVGLSFTSIEGARLNLMHDIKMTYEWVQFDQKIREGQEAWNKELSKIEVFTEDEEKKHIFYTALYHCMIHPNIAEDADGKYRGHDGKIHDSPNHTQYTVFSLWDTYRALHPLMTIIDEQRTTDFINSFLEIYKQSGRLPVWELANNETDCMIGYHSVSVIADAYMKGIRGFDTTLALEAIVASANEDIFGLDSYKKYGFIRAEDEAESVSKTLEYAYDDWCIAQMAGMMGKDSIARVFRRRSESWRNMINPKTGFATPRFEGNWIDDFDPKQVNLHFTEANSWQYSFAQHAGGWPGPKDDLEERLDALFKADIQTTGRTQSDITGLIGQYAHGNEPSHHIAYLYNHTEHPEKGQKIMNQICDSFYTNAPDGLIGNEDCGQMSAWYVLSSSGFYPVAPGSNYYSVGTCQFDSVRYKIGRNKTFVIDNERLHYADPKFKKQYLFIDHKSLVKDKAFTVYGRYLGTRKALKGNRKEPKFICPTPLIQGEHLFTERTSIELSPVYDTDGVYYFIGDDESRPKWYNKQDVIEIDSTSVISAYAVCEVSNFNGKEFEFTKLRSPTISATFHRKPSNWTCTPSIKPNSQYTGGGNDALIDGISGTENWKAGKWQGYQNREVVFNLDFKEKRRIKTVRGSFLQDSRSWILMPSKIELWVNGEFQKTKTFNVKAFRDGSFIENIEISLDQEVKSSAVQLKVYSAGALPKGHQGYPMQGESFFFIDEISVE